MAKIYCTFCNKLMSFDREISLFRDNRCYDKYHWFSVPAPNWTFFLRVHNSKLKVKTIGYSKGRPYSDEIKGKIPSFEMADSYKTLLKLNKFLTFY